MHVNFQEILCECKQCYRAFNAQISLSRTQAGNTLLKRFAASDLETPSQPIKTSGWCASTDSDRIVPLLDLSLSTVVDYAQLPRRQREFQMTLLSWT